MCLLRDPRSRLKAKEDIVCYKVFKVNDNHEIVSPFHTFFIWTPKTVITDKVRGVNHYGDGYVEKGYFHSFKNMDDAMDLCRGVNTCTHFHNAIVCKCIIPKGSYYYKGWFRNRHSFASKSLMILGYVNGLEIV